MGERFKATVWPWAVAVCGAVCKIVTVFALQGIGVLITYIAADFEVTVTDCAIISSVYGLCYGGFGVVWGTVADSIGLRKTMTLCGFGASLSLLLFATLSHDVPTAAFLYGLVGFFGAGIGVSLMPKMIAAWFTSKWSGAGFSLVSIGGTSAGILAGIVIPALLGILTWRGIFMTVSGFGICISFLMFAVIRDTPKKVGLEPFGSKQNLNDEKEPQNKAEATQSAKEKRHTAFQHIIQVLKMSITWKMGIIYIAWEACYYTNSTYMVVTLQNAGYAIAIAGAMLSTHRAAQTIGSAIWPSIPRLARKTVIAIMCVLASCIFVILFFFCEDPEIAPLGMFTGFILMAMLGFSKSLVPECEAQLSELFPPNILGSGSGLIVSISSIGQFCGPLIAGAIIHASGTYNSAWLFSAVCLIFVAIAAIVWLPKTGGKYGNPYRINNQKRDNSKIENMNA